MIVTIEELRRIVHKALTKYGYSEGEIGIIREVLMYAQLRENNQGIVNLTSKGFSKGDVPDEIKIVKETKLSALLNGNKHSDMVVMDKAMRMALQKAKEHGFGIVGMNNTSTSTGSIGYFAHELAEKGFIGFVYAGKNSLAIGVPSIESPVV
jgi:L-2-hydroxycarboxylate dehydrogenase (NAD+)